MKKTSAVRITLTLFLITALTAAALAGVNAITEERIEALQVEKVQAAIAAVLPDGASAQSRSDWPDDTGLVQAVYESPSGYAVQVCVPGFGGDIQMMVGIQGGKVSQVRLISHAETPGLGATAAQDNARGRSFRDQFIGREGPLAVTKDGGDVDAPTSATITSRAVTRSVNAALDCAAGLE